MPVLPVAIDFTSWAAQIRNDYPTITIPLIESPHKWREWASQLIHANNLANVPLPTRAAFPRDEDWKKWAPYFINGAAPP